MSARAILRAALLTGVLLPSFAIVGGPSPEAAAQGGEKVLVCHVPPGNPANAKLISVGAPAVSAHMAHGDPVLEAQETSCEDGKDNDCDGAADEADEDCQNACRGGEFIVTVSGLAFLDETTWTLSDATPNVISSGGPYGFGSTNSSTVITTETPLEFAIETQGFFNDNFADYRIDCEGALVLIGAIGGGQSTTVGNLCCAPLIP